jgi:hypothetical protein
VAELPLTDLYEKVVARFASEAAAEVPPATPPPQRFGWREPDYQGPMPRIVWVPGDGSNAASIVPARNPQTAEGRILYTIEELFTVYVLAADTTNLESEIHQYTAVRLLADYWLRCARLEASTNLEIQSVSWVDDLKLRRRGAALRIVCSIAGGIPDRTLSYVEDVAAYEAAELDDTADESVWIPEEPEV